MIAFWFRRDLRMHDNHALYEALKSGQKVLPVFIFDKNILDQLEVKADSRVQFIHQTLLHLKTEMKKLAADLLVSYGTPEEVWNNWCSAYAIEAVYCNEDYEPYARKRDAQISKLLTEKGVAFHTFKDQVMFAKSDVVKDDGKPYTVYTPYSKKWKALLLQKGIEEYPTHEHLEHLLSFEAPAIPSLTSMGFEPTDAHYPSDKLDPVVLKQYHKTRDFPALKGTSRLGIHLRFGTLSIRELCKSALNGNEKYLNELIWREFYMSILWHFPQVITQSFKPAYDAIEWRNNEEEFDKWCKGKTGYPIVDAGMRELNATGYMHNRVRMIVASFLTKHLLIDWRWGERYFASKLLDYELASNNGGWQWAAGSGVDAAPYFRVFNPYLQTDKFDSEHRYLKKWIPELGTQAYPKPIVDHALARKRCLEIYQKALKPTDSGATTLQTKMF